MNNYNTLNRSQQKINIVLGAGENYKEYCTVYKLIFQ